MPRQKKDPEDNVVPLNPGAQSKDPPAPETPKPTARDQKGGKPTDIDCKAYDRLAEEVHRLQELTGCAGWKQFFGSLLREADEARTQLEFAEKPRDVVKLQATIALVKSQLKKLQQPTEDLNSMRTKWPLFVSEVPWRADFDELTGRVTLVWAGQGEPPSEMRHASLSKALAAQAEPDKATASDAPQEDADPDGDDEDDEDLDATGPGPEPDDPFGE
ncbi:MAG: hypothetical protein WC326_02055 [Candidatus Delongbacteria bacterium]